MQAGDSGSGVPRGTHGRPRGARGCPPLTFTEATMPPCGIMPLSKEVAVAVEATPVSTARAPVPRRHNAISTTSLPQAIFPCKVWEGRGFYKERDNRGTAASRLEIHGPPCAEPAVLAGLSAYFCAWKQSIASCCPHGVAKHAWM